MHNITIHKAYKHVHTHTHTNTLAMHIQFIQTHNTHVHKHIHLCHTIYMLLASYLDSKEKDLS